MLSFQLYSTTTAPTITRLSQSQKLSRIRPKKIPHNYVTAKLSSYSAFPERIPVPTVINRIRASNSPYSILGLTVEIKQHNTRPRFGATTQRTGESWHSERNVPWSRTQHNDHSHAGSKSEVSIHESYALAITVVD